MAVSPEVSAIFIRKGSPIRLATKGLVAAFDETLTKIENPILSFDEFFDLIILGDDVAILNQKNFEDLFKDSEAVLSSAGEWADQLSSELPIPVDHPSYLAERLRKNRNMRRRVLNILNSGYLPELTIEKLREKMKEKDLDSDKLIQNDALVFNKETEKDIILLLNEDLWKGDFSGERYSATKKSKR